MLACLIASLTVLAAPEDEAAAKLRVAWASQYEWKEDGVRNIMLGFEYTGSWTGRDNQEFSFRGKGQVVVADGEVVRRHLPDVAAGQRNQLESELDWVVARFLRPAFEEKFKGVRFGPLSELAGDVVKIPAGGVAFLLKGDRIVGMERNVGSADKPFWVRFEYSPANVGGGYAILEERASYTRAMVKSTESRKLTLRKYDTPPAPQRHVFERTTAAGHLHVELVFSKPTVNADDPVVLDPAARDRLKEAWARQYRLPPPIRIEGTFQRKVDRNLTRARWTPGVKGKFQVWGLDSIEVVVKESRGGERVQQTCLEHLRWAFGLFDVKPFDEEFRGCGFELEEREEGESIVRIFGHADRLAYRIVDGVIVGRLDTGAAQSWWEYKVKQSRGQPVLIERMTRTLNGQEFELPFKYGKISGHLVPRSVAVLAMPRFGGGGRLAFGVAEYRFSRLKVSLPE